MRHKQDVKIRNNTPSYNNKYSNIEKYAFLFALHANKKYICGIE